MSVKNKREIAEKLIEEMLLQKHNFKKGSDFQFMPGTCSEEDNEVLSFCWTIFSDSVYLAMVLVDVDKNNVPTLESHITDSRQETELF